MFSPSRDALCMFCMLYIHICMYIDDAPQVDVWCGSGVKHETGDGW